MSESQSSSWNADNIIEKWNVLDIENGESNLYQLSPIFTKYE